MDLTFAARLGGNADVGAFLVRSGEGKKGRLSWVVVRKSLKQERVHGERTDSTINPGEIAADARFISS